jgi:hypothetical protein
MSHWTYCALTRRQHSCGFQLSLSGIIWKCNLETSTNHHSESEGNVPVTLTHSDKCFRIFCWFFCLRPSSPSTSTLFESENKHNRHEFPNCLVFILDITVYSINFRKLAFVGTLLDVTDTWIGYIGIFQTTCRRMEVKIQRYCIGYMWQCVVARNVCCYEWLVSQINT